jgi:hypothetical protein
MCATDVRGHVDAGQNTSSANANRRRCFGLALEYRRVGAYSDVDHDSLWTSCCIYRVEGDGINCAHECRTFMRKAKIGLHKKKEGAVLETRSVPV